MTHRPTILLALLGLAACAPEAPPPPGDGATAAPSGEAGAATAALPAPAPPAGTGTATPPATADRTIGPEGTAGVRIGATLAELRAAGMNPRITQEPLDAGATCAYARVEGLDDLLVMLDGERIVRLEVNKADTGWRTPEGAGVGTSEADLKRLYGERLEIGPHKYTDGHYAMVKGAGGRGTLFETDGRKVTQWRAGAWDAVQLVEGCA